MASPAPAIRRRPVCSALLVAGAVLLGLGSAVVQVHLRGAYPLREVDTMQRAGSARALLETGQWSTPVLRFWELVGHEHTAEGRPWPVQNWSPGYPLVLAAAFAVWKDYDAAILACSIASYLGCVLLTFLLARRLWDDRAALWATALFLAYGALPLWSALGHIDAAYTLCLLAMTVLLLGPDSSRSPSERNSSRPLLRYLAAGAVLGAAYWLRPTALAWTPLILVAGVGEPRVARRWARAAALGGLALMILLSSGLVRLLSPPPLPATGPSLSYAQMSLRETTDLEATTDQTVTPSALSGGEILRAWPQLAKKTVRGLVEALGNPDSLLPPTLLILAPLGLVLALPHPRRRALGGAVLAAIVLSVLGVVVTVYFGLTRYAASWAPFLAVFAGAGVVWLEGRARQSRARWAVTLPTILLAVGGYVWAALPLTSVSRPPEPFLLAEQVQPLFQPGAVVASPRAYELAWHGGLRGIQTEEISPALMLDLDRRLIRLDGFVLERKALGGEPPERVGEFRKLAAFLVPYEVLKGQEKAREWVVYGR